MRLLITDELKFQFVTVCLIFLSILFKNIISNKFLNIRNKKNNGKIFAFFLNLFIKLNLSPIDILVKN